MGEFDAHSVCTVQLSFLECLSEPKLELLATASKLVSVPTGQCVFKQGDEGYSFYIILHGDVAVSITQTGPSGCLFAFPST